MNRFIVAKMYWPNPTMDGLSYWQTPKPTTNSETDSAHDENDWNYRGTRLLMSKYTSIFMLRSFIYFTNPYMEY